MSEKGTFSSDDYQLISNAFNQSEAANAKRVKRVKPKPFKGESRAAKCRAKQQAEFIVAQSKETGVSKGFAVILRHLDPELKVVEKFGLRELVETALAENVISPDRRRATPGASQPILPSHSDGAVRALDSDDDVDLSPSHLNAFSTQIPDFHDIRMEVYEDESDYNVRKVSFEEILQDWQAEYGHSLSSLTGLLSRLHLHKPQINYKTLPATGRQLMHVGITYSTGFIISISYSISTQ